MHSSVEYVILNSELNRKQQVRTARGSCRGRHVKREAGANPARSRHCDKGVHCQGAFAPVTEPSGLGRRQRALSFQSGNLPAVGTGALPPQITRNWLYQKACKIRGLFALPFRKRKAPFFCRFSFLYPSVRCRILPTSGKENKMKKRNIRKNGGRSDRSGSVRRCTDRLRRGRLRHCFLCCRQFCRQQRGFRRRR